MYTIIYSIFPKNALIYGDIDQGIQLQSLFILPLIRIKFHHLDQVYFFRLFSFISFVAFSLHFLKVWPLFLWKFSLGIYAGSKICNLWICGFMYQIIALSSKHLARHRIFSIPLHIMTIWFTEPQIAAPNTNGSLIWHNF